MLLPLPIKNSTSCAGTAGAYFVTFEIGRNCCRCLVRVSPHVTVFVSSLHKTAGASYEIQPKCRSHFRHFQNRPCRCHFRHFETAGAGTTFVNSQNRRCRCHCCYLIAVAGAGACYKSKACAGATFVTFQNRLCRGRGLSKTELPVSVPP